MKKFAAFALAVSLFLFSPSLISAENSKDSTRQFTQKVQDVKQNTKERMAAKEGERKEKMDNLRIAIVKNFFDNMIKRFEAAEDRFVKILARIEIRVSKIKSENPSADLTKVDAEIASVKTALAENQTKIDSLKTDFEAAIASESPKEKVKTVLANTSSVKKNLEAIKKSLSKIVGEIKGLRVGENQNEQK